MAILAATAMVGASANNQAASPESSNLTSLLVAAADAPKPVEAGPAGAPINTTRSNIKRPGVAAEAPNSAASTPAGAPISTTRSNIKRP